MINNAPLLAAVPKPYWLAATSPRLRQLLLPDGITAPYTTVNCDATLILHDRRGSRATFKRRQTVRFLQDGVSALLDRAWGDGIILTNYQHSAGKLAESFKDGRVRHLVVKLPRPMAAGEQFSFEVERQVMEMFGKSDGWVEMTPDQSASSISRTIIFPKDRPVQLATFESPGKAAALPITRLPDGRTMVRVDTFQPTLNQSYVVRWWW